MYESQDLDLQSVVELAAHRRPRRPRSREASLSRDQIVRAAIRLADEEGGQAISMRRVAASLDAGTMTLYWHVADREALLAYMVDAALGEHVLPAAPSGDWRADLELVARELLAIARRHPWFAVLVGTRPFLLGSGSASFAEFSLSLFEVLDLDMVTLQEVLYAVNSYAIGAALREQGEARPTTAPDAGGGALWADAQAAYLRQIVGSGRYPAFAKLARFLLEGGDFIDRDRRFEAGLACLLDGIAARLASR